MKVTHVNATLIKAGCERVIQELLLQAVDNGDEVTLLVGWRIKPELSLKHDFDDRINMIYIANSRIGAYLMIIPWILCNFKFLKKQNFIHCHLSYGAFFGTIVKCFFLFKKAPKVVETYHAVGMKIPKINRFIHNILIRTKDGVIFMAKDPYWEKTLLRKKNIVQRIIPNGISTFGVIKDRESRNKFCTENGLNDSVEILIGSVSNLRKDRQPLEYIKLTKLLKQSLDKHFYFILGGEGSEKEHLIDKIQEYNLSGNFTLSGLVKNPATFMKNLDIYVSLSVEGTVGISMIEAAMCKIPVVGIQLVSEYKTKDSDWVWSSSDLKEVEIYILKVLSDKTFRENLVNNQFDYVLRNFTSDTMYRSYLDFYKSIN